MTRLAAIAHAKRIQNNFQYGTQAAYTYLRRKGFTPEAANYVVFKE
jgi:hypothetical protein